MKNVVSIAAAICLAFLMMNCKKQQKNLPVIELDADTFIDKHFNYKPGSYWIYRDSIDGRTDSFFVKSNYYFKQGAEYGVYNYHFVNITEYNVDGSSPADSSDWVLNFQNNKVILDYYYGRNGYGWKNDINFNPFFLYPFTVGDNNSNFDTARVNSVDSAMVVGGVAYSHVAQVQQYIHVDSSSGPGLTYIDDLFSVSDSVGMIRMRLYHPFDNINHVWMLQRYKVAKY